jgi:diaminopimelate decarboxylase
MHTKRTESMPVREAMRCGLSETDVRELQRIHSSLEYRDGELYFDDCNVSELYATARVPLIVFSERRLQDNVRCVQAAFTAADTQTKLLFPLKCCYLRECANAVREAGAGAEVMSQIELQLALAYGFPARDIVASGPAKSDAYLELALRAGVGLIIVDSADDMERVLAKAESMRVVAALGVRVTVSLRGAQMYIEPGHKLGFDPHSASFARAIDRALASPWCELVALQAHQLSHCVDAREYGAAVSGLAEVAMELYSKRGLTFSQLDIGGGIESRFLLERAGTSAAELAEAAREALSPIPYRYQLLVEPGRLIAADAAIGVTRVLGERVHGATRWRLTELSSNVLIPLPEIAYYPVPTRLSPADLPWQTFDVADATCASSVLCRGVALPPGDQGHELALLNCGAYTTVFAELWAFRLPRILFLRRNGAVAELFGDAAQLAMFRSAYGLSVSL